MITVPIDEAQENFYDLINKVTEDCEHILIIGKKHNAVLLPVKDWNSMTETVRIMYRHAGYAGLTESTKQHESKSTDNERIFGELLKPLEDLEDHCNYLIGEIDDKDEDNYSLLRAMERLTYAIEQRRRKARERNVKAIEQNEGR